MAKKLQGLKSQNTDIGVAEYTRQIWLAGLGAFVKAQDEGGKLFDVLVAHGKEIEERGKKTAGDKAEEVSSTVKNRAAEAFDKLERVFQDRVARALNRLGVPTNDDVRELSRRVETLNASIQDLLKEETQKPTA